MELAEAASEPVANMAFCPKVPAWLWLAWLSGPSAGLWTEDASPTGTIGLLALFAHSRPQLLTLDTPTLATS